MRSDSLKKRYLAKLSANLVGLAISVVTQAIIPQGLGPRAYGDFHFLSNFITQIVGFLDMGISIGFLHQIDYNKPVTIIKMHMTMLIKKIDYNKPGLFIWIMEIQLNGEQNL